MDYLIIKSRILDEVTVLVNRHLAEGWEIVGGVACNNYFYCQAMVKADPILANKPDGIGSFSYLKEGETPKRSHKKKT